MKFKAPELETEFNRSHPKVQALALYADLWAKNNMGSELLVTDVDRPQSDYDEIYKAKINEGQFFLGAMGVKHYSGPRPHLYDPLHGVLSHAVDFGIEHDGLVGSGRLSSLEAHRLAEHLNSWWPRTDGKPTALVHDVGSGDHLHCQVQV